ncbi:MAG: hypothetical protein RLZZ367_51 [Bacteroidota bacterium]|jgi:hypothetical protein
MFSQPLDRKQIKMHFLYSIVPYVHYVVRNAFLFYKLLIQCTKCY